MKVLELKFKNADGKIITYSLEEPIEPLDPATISATMEEIITQNAFTSSGGDLVAKHSARLVDRTVEDIELV